MDVDNYEYLAIKRNRIYTIYMILLKKATIMQLLHKYTERGVYMFCYYCGTEFEGNICPKCNREQSKLEGGDGFFDIVKELNLDNTDPNSNVNIEPIAPQKENEPVVEKKDDTDMKNIIDELQKKEAEYEKECEDIKGKYSELKKQFKKYGIIAVAVILILVAIDIAGFVCISKTIKTSDRKLDESIVRIEEKTAEIEGKLDTYVNATDFENTISEQKESIDAMAQSIEGVEKKSGTLEKDIKKINDSIEKLKKAIEKEDK